MKEADEELTRSLARRMVREVRQALRKHQGELDKVEEGVVLTQDQIEQIVREVEQEQRRAQCWRMTMLSVSVVMRRRCSCVTIS
jgi:hypothetical protein